MEQTSGREESPLLQQQAVSSETPLLDEDEFDQGPRKIAYSVLEAEERRAYEAEEYIIISAEEAAKHQHPLWLRIIATAGSVLVNFLPWLLYYLAYMKTTLYSVVYIGLFLWMLCPKKIPIAQIAPASPGRPTTDNAFAFRLFPSTRSVLCSVLVAVVYLIGLISYYFLCAFRPSGARAVPVLWALLGAGTCGTEGDAPIKVMLSASWPPLVALTTSIPCLFYLRLMHSTNEHSFDVWPGFLSPYSWLRFVILRVLSIEWAAAIVAALASTFRRCLLSVPLLCFFAAYVFFGAVRRKLYLVGAHSRPLLLSRKIFTALLLYSTAVVLTYVAWSIADLIRTVRCDGPDVEPSPTTTSKARFLVTAFGEDIASNFVHWILLGLLVSALGIARFILTVSGINNGPKSDSGEEDEEPPLIRISDLESVLAAVRTFLYKEHRILNPILLFLVLNFCASLLGIVWVLLWVLIIVSKGKSITVKAVVCWGVLHLLLVFVAGFQFLSNSDSDRLELIGLKFANASDATATFMILLAILYNAFVLSAAAAESRQQVFESGVVGSSANIFAARIGEAHSGQSEELQHSAHLEVPQTVPMEHRGSQYRNTLADLAARRLSSLQYLIRKYFYILAFLALFIAAVVRINVLHAVFLFLFAIIVAWRPVPKSLWGLLAIYTSIITIAIYAVHAAVRTRRNSLLITFGFLPHDTPSWEMWPYFVWCCFFAIQFHISRARIQEQSYGWTKYIPIFERLLAGVFSLFNCALFALMACTQRASIYGLIYMLFFIVTTTLLMLTSLHSPGRWVRIYWRVVVGTLVFLVTSVYLYSLFPPSLKDSITEGLARHGFTPAEVGIVIESKANTGESSLGVWPLVSSLMLSIVQWRVWSENAKWGERAVEADAIDQIRLIRVVRRVVLRANRLLEVYSLTIATSFLFVAAVSCLCRPHYHISLINVFFFLMALTVGVSKKIRTSDMFWIVLQTLASVLCLAQYMAQLPLWGAPKPSTRDWQEFVGIVVRSNDGKMYLSVSPSLLVFVTVAVHVHIRQQAHPRFRASTTGSGNVVPSFDGFPSFRNVRLSQTNLRDSTPPRNRQASSRDSAVPFEQSTTSVPPETKPKEQYFESVYYFLSHPIEYFDIAGYHLVLLGLFLASILQIRCLLGPVYFLLVAIVAAIGRDGMRRFLRWTSLCLVLFTVLIVQYAMYLGNPPGVSISTSLPADQATYLSLTPSKFSTIVAMLVWILADLEHISLSRRFPMYHWFFGLPFGDRLGDRLTMTERLSRFHVRIKAARQHNAVHLLHRLIPVPLGAEDFSASPRAMDRLKHAMYKHFPTIVLIIVFIHAVYDARNRLVLTKLASLFICLLFLQSLREAGWHGNHWWKWLLRFHCVWCFCRMLYNVPWIQETDVLACAFQYLHLQPSKKNLFVWTDEEPNCNFDCQSDGSCGAYTVFELWFHALVICLLWVQSAHYDRDEYAFVLHHRFINDLESQILGKKIRAERVRLIHEAKEKMAQNLRERRTLLERVWSAHRSMRIWSAKTTEGIGRSGAASREEEDPLPRVSARREDVRPDISPQKILDDTLREAKRQIEVQRLPHGAARAERLQQHQSHGRDVSPQVDSLDRTTIEVLSRVGSLPKASLERMHRLEPSPADETALPVEASPMTKREMTPLLGRDKEKKPSPREERAVAGELSMKIPLEDLRMEETLAAIRPDMLPSRVSSAWNTAIARWFILVDALILWLDRNSISHPSNRVREKEIPGRRFWSTVLGVYRFGLSYTDRLAYIFFFIQFFMSPSLMSSLLPISVLVYAVSMNPRPHRGYWSSCVIYLQIMMLLKSFLKVWYCSNDNAEIPNETVEETFAMSDLSIGLFGGTCGSDDYIVDMSLKLTCMMCCTLHKNHLRHWGLWDDRELDTLPSDSKDENNEDDEEPPSTVFHKCKSAMMNVTREDCKTGDDLYTTALGLELASFVYLFIAYYKLVGLDDSVVDSLKHSILPGFLAVALCILFLVMVIDRIVYLKRSVFAKYILNVVLTLTYHAILIFWFVRNARLYKIKVANFSLSGNFYESLIYAGILYYLKMYYLYLSAAQVQSGFFSYTTHLVFSGTYRTGEYILYWVGRLVPFLFDLRVILDWTVTKTYLKLWYFMKLEDICHELYLVEADHEDNRVLQDAKGGDDRLPYPAKYKLTSGVLLFLLLAVVLLFPLVLYSSFSPMAQTNSVTMLSASLSLEGFPPVWESSNRLISSRVPPCHHSNNYSQRSKFPFQINTTIISLLEQLRPSLRGVGLSSTGTVQLLTMSNYSSSVWSISPPARNRMLHLLEQTNDTLSLILEISVRSSASLAMTTPSVLRQHRPLDYGVRRGLTGLLKGTASAIKIPNLLNPFLFNKPQNDFSYFEDESNSVDCYLATNNEAGDSSSYQSRGLNDSKPSFLFFTAWCNTLFERSNPSADGCWADLSTPEWNCLRMDICPNYETKEGIVLDNTTGSFGGNSSMYFMVLSTTVMGVSLLQSVGIVTVYATFVFAIGRVLRFGVAGGTFRVVIEDIEDPTYLVNLVEFLFIVRAQGDFRLEKEVFHHFMDVLRVTERLERETRKKED